MLALGASQALAATLVGVETDPVGSTLVIEDETDDDDRITVARDGGLLVVTDDGAGGATTTDPDECNAVNASTIACEAHPDGPPPPAPPNAVVRDVDLDLGDGVDSFTSHVLDLTVVGGASGASGAKTITISGDANITTGLGDDTVDTGPGEDFVVSGDGDDTISTAGSFDIVTAGFGDDFVSTGAQRDAIQEDEFANGADTLDAGPGEGDGISYGFGGLNPVSLSLNGQPDDGHAGEGDNLLGVETLDGSDGDDTIAGDDTDNTIFARAGNDTITGAGGDDRIFPESGDDSADGGEGADSLAGDEGDGTDVLAGGGGSSDSLFYDYQSPVTMTLNGLPDDGVPGEGDNITNIEGLTGGSGDDTIAGNASNNALSGGDGDDTITGRAGNDSFSGGDGDDTLLALGGQDVVACGLGFDASVHDAVDLVSGDCERRGAEVVSESARAGRKGKATVRVSCPAEEGSECGGTLALFSNGKRIATGNFDVPDGSSERVTVRLSKKGRRSLRTSHGSLVVTAEARTDYGPQDKSANAERLQLIRGRR